MPTILSKQTNGVHHTPFELNTLRERPRHLLRHARRTDNSTGNQYQEEPSYAMGQVIGGKKDDSRVLGALEELDAIAITEILDHNSRPTFIIDLDPDLDTVVNPDKLSSFFL
jgi:hypothetical protein